MEREKASLEFGWVPEYDELLEQIASTDNVDVEWTRLRDMIKYKINQNISLFLSGEVKPDYERTVTALPGPGGLKLPPFPPRERNGPNPSEAPKNVLTEKEATNYRDVIYAQLNEFEGSPPFTIQRICELCLRPTEHYKQLGKYLRAVEKSLLVTSTWDAFPALTDGASSQPNAGLGSISTTSLSASAPTTPMFSPIPFLHEDARRSSSRSPPPSPLVLPAMGAGGTATTAPHAGAENAEQKVLGLVDEMDDPSPGHLSEHPRAISSTTTVDTKPLHGSLEERFVKGKTEESKAADNLKDSGGGGSMTTEVPDTKKAKTE
ncbi:hypothetical protein AcV7_009033 [Taiwanofungus camphoratus]|nr:hypothetical protein AcV7_009033 [Antrodia cinnamomea]